MFMYYIYFHLAATLPRVVCVCVCVLGLYLRTLKQTKASVIVILVQRN